MKVKIALLFFCVIAYIFLPTTIILAFGMMPTIAAYSMDRSVGKNKTICVGLMNFAGCFPFLLEFWTEFGQQTVSNAFSLIADVQTVLVVYMLAAGGYAIDIAVSGIMSSFILQRSKKKLEKMQKEQKKLIDRWGEKVTGKYKLDDFGFPIRPIADKTAIPKDPEEAVQVSDKKDT